jgi:RNA polymerase sigma-B factor
MATGYHNPINGLEEKASVPARRSEEDVLQLLMSYRSSKDNAYRDRIVVQFTALVESIARRYATSGEPADDLAQEGYIGLITAIELYDVTKNVKFSTYATHFVIGQIKHYLRDRGKIIKEPAWLQELNQRIVKRTEKLAQDLQRQPTQAEIAAVMGMTEDAVAEVVTNREVFKVTSMDGGQDQDDDNNGTIDIDRQTSKDLLFSFEVPLDERLVLESAIENLKPLEQQVIAEFYFQDLNQTEIAAKLGISCNYVSHLLRNAAKKMRKILNTEDLKDAQIQLSGLRKKGMLTPDFQAEALVDDLTRLYTRAYFERRLEEELLRAGRLDANAAVVFIQLAGFSAFTAAVGTLKSDEIMRSTCKVVRTNVRRSDILTRYSHDHLAMILPYTGEHVRVVVDRLTAALEGELGESRKAHNGANVDWNFGSSIYPKDGTTWQRLSSIALENVGELAEKPEGRLAA